MHLNLLLQYASLLIHSKSDLMKMSRQHEVTTASLSSMVFARNTDRTDALTACAGFELCLQQVSDYTATGCMHANQVLAQHHILGDGRGDGLGTGVGEGLGPTSTAQRDQPASIHSKSDTRKTSRQHEFTTASLSSMAFRRNIDRTDGLIACAGFEPWLQQVSDYIATGCVLIKY